MVVYAILGYRTEAILSRFLGIADLMVVVVLRKEEYAYASIGKPEANGDTSIDKSLQRTNKEKRK